MIPAAQLSPPGTESRSTGTTAGPVFTTGDGPWLLTGDGERYFDGTAGSGAVTLGHQYAPVVEAAAAQLGALTHTGCKLGSAPRKMFTDRLAEISPYPDAVVLPTATGSEAVESALKIARAVTGRHTVVGFRYGYHGKTAGALGLTWRAAFKEFSDLGGTSALTAELPDPRLRRPVDLGADLASLDAALVRASALGGAAAVVLEPVQVTEGVLAVDPVLLDAIAARARRHGALFVLDEIYTGLGRCGQLFYGDLLAKSPDLTVVGKTLGNGFPIAAVTGPRELVDALPAGVQTSTFSGHPVSCAAAHAVLGAVTDEKLPARARQLGDRLAEDLAALARRHEWITAVRTSGALAAFDCASGGQPDAARAKRFVADALRLRLLLFGGGPEGATVKIVPPVLLDEQAYRFLLDALSAAACQPEGK